LTLEDKRMASENTNKINLSTITVNIEDLFNKICEMREAGEKVVQLDIMEPMPDIELGKHLSFEAFGTCYGGATDYDYIAESTPEEKEAALWNEDLEEDIL